MLWTCLALAASADATEPAAPAPPTVSARTARALDWGELAIGTQGLMIGVIPQVHVGTRPLLDVAGLPNGSGRIEALRAGPVSLALDGSYVGSSLDGLSLSIVDAGPELSLRLGKLDVHAGSSYQLYAQRGVPDALPSWVLGLFGPDAAGLWSAELAPAFRTERLVVHGLVEIHATPNGRLIGTGSGATWGRSSIASDPVGALEQLGVSNLLEGSTLEETWTLLVGWQQTAGVFTVRAGLGASAQEWAWLRDALSVTVRLDPLRQRPEPTLAADGAAEDDAADDAAADDDRLASVR